MVGALGGKGHGLPEGRWVGGKGESGFATRSML